MDDENPAASGSATSGEEEESPSDDFGRQKHCQNSEIVVYQRVYNQNNLELPRNEIVNVGYRHPTPQICALRLEIRLIQSGMIIL